MAGWRGPAFPGDFPSLGWQVLDWLEANLIVPDGLDYGRPFVPTEEQARFIVRLLAVDPVTGKLRHRRGQIVRPKGWGKSPLLASLSIASVWGPMWPAGWDAAGQPVGQPWPGTPWVQIAAVSEDQGDNTYALLLEMLHGPVATEHRFEAGLMQVRLPGGGLIETVTSSAGSREGQRVHFATLDEPHLWWPTNGGVRLAATIRRNLAKTNGLSVETTNAWRPGDESVAERTAEAATSGEPGVFSDHVQAPAVSLSNKAELRRALRKVYGDARWIDLDRIVAEIADPATTDDDARRFYLNQVVASSDAWVDPVVWAQAADAAKVVGDREQITLGFDGSRYDDSTVLVGCRVSDGHLFVLGAWERPDGGPGEGWEVPQPEVDAVVHQAFTRWRVVRMYADPPYWRDEVDGWAREFSDKVVAKWDTNRDRPMAAAHDRFLAALKSGELTHDGSTVLARHIGNARTRVTRAGTCLRKDRPGSPRKIDGAIAATLAYEARADVLATVKRRGSGRVYSFRD